ncbi:MAG: phage terminase large subunit [Candidatus Magnetobacterium sp. LHC-1]
MSKVIVDINYVAQPKQVLFHLSDADETLFGGAKGGGKSCCLVMDAVAYSLKFKRSKVYLFRKTFDELEANLVDELFKRVPEKTKDNPHGLYTYDRGKHIASFPNGSRIFFRYVRNVQDAKKYAGREMDYLGVDELTQHEEETIQILMSCMRSPLGYPTRFKGTANPGNIGHMWCKKRYIDPTKYGKRATKDKETDNKIIFIPAKVYDNKALIDNDPRYVKRLENLPTALREAFLEGNWNIFEDQAFDDFRPDIHVIPSKPIPAHWRRWRSCDNGYTDPFCFHWFAVDEKGSVHVYREYTRDYDDKKVAYSDQAKKVIELSTYRDIEDGVTVLVPEKIDFTICGHDAWQTMPQTKTAKDPRGKQIVDHYRDGGLNDCVRAITDRKQRKACIHEYLKLEYDDGGKVEQQKLYIHDCCVKLIETLPLQVLDEKDIEKYADTNYDHWVDCFGYGLLAYSAKQSKPLPEEQSRLQKSKARAAEQASKFKKRLM